MGHDRDRSGDRSQAVILTGGIGSFTPRPIPVGEEWIGRGAAYFVPKLAEYADRDVVIVGGGDSAFDWAWSLQPLARSVTIVHRREEFRAHSGMVEKCATWACASSPAANSTPSAARTGWPRSMCGTKSAARSQRCPRRPWSPRSASSPTSARSRVGRGVEQAAGRRRCGHAQQPAARLGGRRPGDLPGRYPSSPSASARSRPP